MITDEYRISVARGLRKGAMDFEPFDGHYRFSNIVCESVDVCNDMEYTDVLERLADLIEPSDAKCRCIDCEYGMVPNCYGVYCRCLARYMEPDGFCSLAKRRADR